MIYLLLANHSIISLFLGLVKLCYCFVGVESVSDVSLHLLLVYLYYCHLRYQEILERILSTGHNGGSARCIGEPSIIAVVFFFSIIVQGIICFEVSNWPDYHIADSIFLCFSIIVDRRRCSNTMLFLCVVLRTLWYKRLMSGALSRQYFLYTHCAIVFALP
jgi:hypothetical protein